MLHTLVVVSLILGVVSLLVMVVDILNGHKQKMMIMNVVYPITGLYAGPLALWVYFTIGRKSLKKDDGQKKEDKDNNDTPFWKIVIKGALHCGSGCTLADMIAETTLLFIPFVLFGKALYGAWVVDYISALAIGIIFQYFAIVPMKGYSFKKGVIKAFKADFFSLTSWQIGMYGWMAISTFLIFHHELKASEPLFWFMMQIAMLCGFLTAYPMNWLLIKKGVKEKM